MLDSQSEMIRILVESIPHVPVTGAAAFVEYRQLGGGSGKASVNPASATSYDDQGIIDQWPLEILLPIEMPGNTPSLDQAARAR